MEKLSLIFSAFVFLGLAPEANALTSEYFRSDSFPIVVEFGLQYLHPSFSEINGVVVRSQRTSNETAPVKGGVNQNYPDVFAQTIHAKIKLNEAKKAALSLRSFLPLNSMTRMDTGNTYLPEYVLYRVENQRPRVFVMGEMNLSDSWRAGLGFDLGFGITSEAVVFLNSGAGNYSDQRVSASLKPKVVPMGSLEYEGYRLLVKGENKVDFTLNTAAGVSAFSTLGAGVDLTYSTSSALFFDPWIFDLSRRFGGAAEEWGIELGVSYQLWSRYRTRAAVISNISSTFSNGLAPTFKARNIVVPRIAIEKSFDGQRWELGYEFKDSIFAGTPALNGNYLDPPRHAFSLGAIFPFSSGWELGASLQVSRLVPQSVVKIDPTEIGAPGYRASGWLYGGSLKLTVPFEAKQATEAKMI